jgi:hypothetical protein
VRSVSRVKSIATCFFAPAYAFTFLTSANAAAAEPSVDVVNSQHEVAITNFAAGRRMVEQGNCKQAIPRFLVSIRAEPNVGARFNLAQCSKTEGKLADAWNHFKAAEQLALTRSDSSRAKRAHEESAGLEARVSKLRVAIKVSGANPPSVTIDDIPVLEADLLMLAMGYAVSPNETHVITIKTPGYEPWTTSAKAGRAGTELTPITAEPKALPAPEPVPDADLPSGPPVLRTAGFITAGVGLGGLAVGTVFGLMAMNRNAAFESAVADPANGCGQDLQTCSESIKRNREAIDGPATIATVSFIAGGTLFAAGVLMVLLAPSRKDTATVQAFQTRAQTQSAHAHVNVGPGSVWIAGSF